MNQILVTGANGFIGQSFCAEALRRGFKVRSATRFANEVNTEESKGEKAMRSDRVLSVGAEYAVVGPIDGETEWSEALHDIDMVIHLAARVHVMNDIAADPLAEFQKVNLRGTVNLAYQAARAGVKRLVYVSTIKVNGEWTTETQPFTELDKPDPQDAYAISKCQAEQALSRIERETGLEIVIVRTPLVYGPGVKGNFRKLLAAVHKGIPLPLASVRNVRSLIYLGNLVSALIACAIHPAAAGKIYLVRDDEDISVSELIRQLAHVLGSPARMLPVPVSLLRGLGVLFGRRDSVNRLIESLRIDDSLIRRELGWKPEFTLRQGLQITADWYRTSHL